MVTCLANLDRSTIHSANSSVESIEGVVDQKGAEVLVPCVLSRALRRLHKKEDAFPSARVGCC